MPETALVYLRFLMERKMSPGYQLALAAQVWNAYGDWQDHNPHKYEIAVHLRQLSLHLLQEDPLQNHSVAGWFQASRVLASFLGSQTEVQRSETVLCKDVGFRLVSEGAQKELRWIMSSIHELSLPMTKLHLAFTCRPLTGTKQPWFGSSWKASRANFKMAVGDWPFSSFRELQSWRRPRPIEKQSEPMNA